MTDLLFFIFGLTTGLLLKSLFHNALTSAVFKFMNSAPEETKETNPGSGIIIRFVPF